MELRVRSRWVHSHDELTGHLRSDYVVGNAVGDLATIKRRGDEIEKRVVDSEKIFSVLERVFETAFGDLRKLAGPIEPGRGEGIRS